MKNIFKFLVLSLVSLAPQAGWCKMVFICHKGLGYDEATIRRSYTGQLDEPHMADNKALKSELLKFVDHSDLSYKRMWTKQYFRRAITPPVLKENDQAVIEFVAKHHEGIGYVSAAPKNNSEVEVCGNN
jgi:hypothetical protein